MRAGFARLEFRQYDFSQHFAEFDTPLIEAVDVPDNALDKNLVLIECDQRSQGSGCQLFEED